jgi:hypothetical protein
MTWRRAVGLLVLIGCVCAQACASARVRRDTTLAVRDADALVARGCHACLVEALAIYERLTPRDSTQLKLVGQRIVRTSLLLALRAKELGLDPQPYFDRVRVRVSPNGTAAERERLELAEALRSNPSGLTREQIDRENQRYQAAREKVDARLARDRTTASDDRELDAYLDLALLCWGRVMPQPNAAKPESLLPDGEPSPLLSWRVGICGLEHEPRLDAAVAAEPRFTEAAFFAGRYRLLAGRAGGPPGRFGPRPSLREAREALTRAHTAFPASPGITMELANVVRQISYPDALALYVEVIDKVRTHEDAWIGKGICESHLGRHTDAVATFTHVIGLTRWQIGTAYYWRAWNRHQLKELDAAWSDVETAKQTLYNSPLYTLAGIIAYDRQQLDVARPNLEKGRELEARNCIAAWYLGLVHAGKEGWPASADTFSAAATCYRLDADDARRDLANAEALDDREETKASQIASARGVIEESMRQEALSAYNAAYGFVRAQTADRARPLLEVARQHADVKGRADELLAYVDRH